jgi:Ca2+-binding EF-hand superfamily protein
MSAQVATTNQDDVLDQDELNQILIKIRQHCFTHRGVDPEQLFNRWDRDKDGTLDYDEMRLLMYKVLSTSEQEFEQLFTFIDKDGDDLISLQEFCDFVHTKPTKGAVLKTRDSTGMNNPERQSQDFFRQLKPSVRKASIVGKRWKADDTLDKDELLLVHRKIRAASYTHRGTDIPALFAEWDVDNDGTLTREEFYTAIKKLVSGITPPEFGQLCDIIDTEKTGGIDVVMIQNFIEKYDKGWKRAQVKRGEEDDNPVNDAVANSKFFGGLRPSNNQLNDHSLKKHGRKNITPTEMKRLRKKVCAESYTTGGMDLRRVYDRFVPQDNKADMRAVTKFLRLALPTLKCLDEINFILVEWGLNKHNDGSLRYADFVKWAKKKEPKKLKYRSTKVTAARKHLGKAGIPMTSRFSGHTMGKRYIADDDMFNNLIPLDLFKDLDRSYHKRTSDDAIKKAAAAAGIDMDALASDLSESSGEEEDDYGGEAPLSREEKRLREVLDLGSWSDSDGEDSASGGGRGDSHSKDLNEYSDFYGEASSGSPDGSPKKWAQTKSIYGDGRQFGGGRFMLPTMPDMTGKSPFYGPESDANQIDAREDAAVNYYWNKNEKEGRTRVPLRKAPSIGADDEDDEGNSGVGKINVNFVADPDEAQRIQSFVEDPSNTYGLFGTTAKLQSGGIEDLMDPGTWNFSAGQAIGAINRRKNGPGEPGLFDSITGHLSEDNPYRLAAASKTSNNQRSSISTDEALVEDEEEGGGQNAAAAADEDDEGNGSDFGGNPYGGPPAAQRRQPQRQHPRPQPQRGRRQGKGGPRGRPQQRQPKRQPQQRQGGAQPRQQQRQTNQKRKQHRQGLPAQTFDQGNMSFGQQQNQQMLNSPRKPSTMSPSHRRPHAGGRRMQPNRKAIRSPRAAPGSPRVQQPIDFYRGDSSVPPSPRSLRSERSARSSNVGEPRMNKDRVKSSAKWDPKKKKFVKA